MPRIAAALVAFAAWAGLAIQFNATLNQVESLPATLFVLARYFTVLTNLLVAMTFTAVALGRPVSSFWLGCVTLAIVLVGVVYMLLLRGLLDLSGGARTADALLHNVVPLLTPAYWLLFAPKGRLRWRDPLIWSGLPIIYLAYALIRGRLEGRYAYPFIDVGALGLGQTLINSLAIGACFVIAGLAMVAMDSAMGRTSRKARA
jgi:hypothetical protein